MASNSLVIAIAIGMFMLALEFARPAVARHKVKSWYLRAISFNVFQVGTVVTAGWTWNRWLQGYSLFELRNIHPVLGALIAYFVSTLVFYWWHRVRHESHFWWRVAHQIHHSASRIEILASFYKHPFEIVINSVLSSVIVFPVLGCSVQQSAYYTLMIAVGEMIYHWNVHTPRFIGYFFQRPESHRIHHQRGKHSKNYSDLAIWDQLWGTFSNPKNGDKVSCGFSSANEDRIRAMLATKEVEVVRTSEPLDLRICCLGCGKRHKCESL